MMKYKPFLTIINQLLTILTYQEPNCQRVFRNYPLLTILLLNVGNGWECGLLG